MTKENVELKEKEIEEKVEETKIELEMTVSRSKYTAKDGDERYSYFVSGDLRGKDVKANLIPTDIGGYEIIELIFLTDETAKLRMIKTKMSDQLTKQINEITSYEMFNFDESGDEIVCKVKPWQSSDKYILDMLNKKKLKAI